LYTIIARKIFFPNLGGTCPGAAPPPPSPTPSLCFFLTTSFLFRARKLPFALKVIETGKVKGQEEVIENEVAILRRLKNRNIIQLIEEFHTPSATFLVMELVTVCIYSRPSSFSLPPPKEVMFFVLSVCLSVRRITEKVVNGF